MYNLLAQVTGRKRVMLYSPQDTLHLNLTGKTPGGRLYLLASWKWYNTSTVTKANVLHVHTQLFTFTSNLVSGDKSERLAIDCSNLGWFPEFVKAWWYSCTRTCFFQSLVWAGWMMKLRALFKSVNLKSYRLCTRNVKVLSDWADICIVYRECGLH